MTVLELIQQLQLLPQDITVVVRNYEGGYDDVSISKIFYIDEMKCPEEYLGKYDDSHELLEGSFKAICL